MTTGTGTDGVQEEDALTSTQQPDSRGVVDASIGVEVRRIRALQGLSLAEVAARSGVSKAMISRIENAQTSCSLATLSRLADGLGTKLSAFFREADTPRDAVFTAAGEGSRFFGRDNRFTRVYEQLGTLPGQAKRLEANLITLTDPDDTLATTFYQHRGEIFVYLLEGALVYGHGTVSYTLRPGDSLLMDGEGWHGPKELLRHPARYLSVSSYGGPPAPVPTLFATWEEPVALAASTGSSLPGL